MICITCTLGHVSLLPDGIQITMGRCDSCNTDYAPLIHPLPRQGDTGIDHEVAPVPID